jgi:hypothetical protein
MEIFSMKFSRKYIVSRKSLQKQEEVGDFRENRTSARFARKF